MDGAADEPLAVYRRRRPGEIRRVVLQTGDPALYVDFAVPDGVALAAIEAAAQTAAVTLLQTPALLERYGLGDRMVKEADLLTFSRVLVAVEAAISLWRGWNYAVESEDGSAPIKAQLSPPLIATLLIDDLDIRAAWMLHLDAASPLERSEGNGSGVSPNTNSDEAPDTAMAAESPAAPAPEGSPNPTESSAQE